MIGRDSLVIILGILASVIGYLIATDTPFWQWTYPQWLQGLAFVVGLFLAWLRGSPLAASTTPPQDQTTALGIVRMYTPKEPK